MENVAADPSITDWISTIANVLMALAAVCGVLGWFLWKRQPTWEHGRNVAAEGYAAAGDVLRAMVGCEKSAWLVQKQLKGKDPQRAPEEHREAKTLLRESGRELVAAVGHLHSVNGRVRATWGDEIANVLALFEEMGNAFAIAVEDHASEEIDYLAVPARWDVSEKIPWYAILKRHEPQATLARDCVDSAYAAIRSWAKEAGAVGEPSRETRQQLIACRNGLEARVLAHIPAAGPGEGGGGSGMANVLLE